MWVQLTREGAIFMAYEPLIHVGPIHYAVKTSTLIIVEYRGGGWVWSPWHDTTGLKCVLFRRASFILERV